METTTQRTVGGITYTLTRRRVKNLNLRVHPDGSVAVSAGARVPLREIDAFVASRREWITAAQQRLQERRRAEGEQPTPDKAEALAYFTNLCARRWPEFSAICPKGFPAIKVRTMTSRWGSCNLKTNTLTFNTRLMLYPEACREYVVVHEFCHFAHADHSPAFWAAVERHLPEWKRLRRLLRENPGQNS